MEILKPYETLNPKLQSEGLKNGARLILEKDLFSIEFDENQSLNNFLISLYQKGYLFHGSSRLIDVLKTQQANCKEKKDGNLDGIYFTSNPDLAKFCAICGGIDGKRLSKIQRSFNEETKSLEYVTAEFGFSGIPADSGYIYVIPKNKTQQLKNDNGDLIDEFVCFKPVAPLLRIKIKKDQFPFEIEKI